MISSELLKRADLTAGADYGHEIVRLQLFINKFSQRISRSSDTDD
jgi:hypothetical protein